MREDVVGCRAALDGVKGRYVRAENMVAKEKEVVEEEQGKVLDAENKVH